MSDDVTDPIWTPTLNALLGYCSRATTSQTTEFTPRFQKPNSLYHNSEWIGGPVDRLDRSSSDTCNCIESSSANDALNIDRYSALAWRCLPHCQRNCKYESFLFNPQDGSDPSNILQNSISSFEDDLQLERPALEYYSDSATDSLSSNSCELASSQIKALSLQETKSSRSDPTAKSPFKIQPCPKAVASPLCPSLFRNVPPFIRFRMAFEDMYPLPVEVRRLLHWKLSPITPVVVRQIVVRSGFRLARKSSEWSGIWGKHMKSIEFRFIRDGQKVNHFPGSHHLGRKDNLLNHIKRSKALFKDVDYDFLPETYLLPKELKQLYQSWKASGTRQAWIVKPPASARGSGIYLVCKWSQVPKKQPSVVQRYIPNPYLINGSKFDLRVYVLVTDFNPLKIYIYPDGLVRFASVKYSASLRTLSDRFMHLTNYSVNKKNSAYVSNEDAYSRQGHKWTLRALWDYLADRGEDVDSLWDKIVDIVIKTIISAEGSFNQLIGQNVASSYTCFELFGFDIMLDSNLKPWLLEVNISPSLHASSKLDASVKSPLVKDMFNIVGFHIPDRMNATNQQNVLHSFGLSKNTNNLCINKSYYHTALSSSDKSKHEKFMSGQKKLLSILEELTPDDVRKLMQSEDELSHRGRFVRVFPCATGNRYLEVMLNNRYYNLLLLAWELQFSKNREEGIRHLQSFAEVNYHLKSSWKLPLLKEDSITRDSSSDDATSKTSVDSLDGYVRRAGVLEKGRLFLGFYHKHSSNSVFYAKNRKLAYKTGSKTKRIQAGVPRKILHKILQQKPPSDST